MVSGSPLIPRDAATVLIFREGSGGFEVFMVRRSSASPFIPDAFVFPGGAVDPEDAALAAGTSQDAVDAVLRVSAVRESFEEAGVLFADQSPSHDRLAAARAALLRRERTFAQTLDDLGARIDPTQLILFSRWITPPSEARRFDARFYVARLPEGQIASADAYETEDGLWITPDAALARHRQGTFAMIFPTIKHLARLSRFSRLDELFAFARTKTIVTVEPTQADRRTFALPAELEDAW
jgi:8-oxo-dGTP pyrophosphatase MutT (NUDIX family)